MKLITEEIEQVEVIVENRNGKKNLFIEGVFLQSEMKNRNGRMYPKATLAREVGRYNENFVEKGRALGELGHPDGPTVNLDRVSHKIVSVQEARTIGFAQFGAKLTVDHDSRALNSDNAVTTTAAARRELTVSAVTDHTTAGQLFAQQVQISGAQ